MDNPESIAEIERIEKIWEDPNATLDECHQYIDREEFVGFDFMPPILNGHEHWYAHVGYLMKNTPKYEGKIVRREIHAGDEHGFANSILHFEMFDDDGNVVFAGDLRQTICYKKKNGKWYQVTQHASVPVDLSTRQPVFENKW